MKVFSKIAADAINGEVVRVNDVQIQSSCAKLGFKVLGDLTMQQVDRDVTLRIKHVSNKGTFAVIEKTPLITLLEIGAHHEGFFIQTDGELSGTIDLTSNGKAIDLNSGYLSLDIDSGNTSLTKIELYTLDAPELTNSFLHYNPLYVNGGITKEIDLAGVEQISLPISFVESIQLSFEQRSITFVQEELRMIANDINDKVTQDVDGFLVFVTLDVTGVRRMTLTPDVDKGFNIYLLQEKVL